MADKNLILQLLITAKDQASTALQNMRIGIASMGDAVSRALEPLRTFSGLLATGLGIGGAKELQDRADAYTRLTNSLKVATSSEQDYQAALKDVAAIAGRTNADIEVTAQLYGKVAQSAKEMGLSQQQVGQLTEAISKGMQLSGASAETASGAILQLTQAFGSGALRGEEFNSVMEASPELLKFLAAGLGVTIGELRGLAEQGALTSRAVSAALLAQKDAIDKAYGETTRTVGQAFTALNNQLVLYIGKLNESTGATATIGATLKLLADNLNVVAAAAGAGLVTALGRSTQALISYARESFTARVAAREHAIAAAAQREAALAAAQGNLAAAQAAVNRAIAEQRAAQVALQTASGDAAVASARAAAAAAAQTATAATNRYIVAQAALNAAQAATATGATLLSRAMGFLAGPGGLILLAVSAFGALLPILSDNKNKLTDLSVSTDQYTESLKNLSTAQLQKQILDLNEAIKNQRSVVKDAEEGVSDYVEINDLYTGQTVRIKRTEEELIIARSNLADKTDALNVLVDKLKIAQDLLNASKKQSLDQTGKEMVQYEQIILAMSNYDKNLENIAKQQKTVSTANQERIQAEIELAKAAGDLQKVDQLTLELATAKATASQQQADLDRAAAVAANLKLDAVQKEYNLIKEKKPKDEENLILARQDAELKNAQAAASQAVANNLKDQATRTSELNTAQLGLLSQQEKLLTSLLKEQEASITLAKAKGNEYEARQLIISAATTEARLAQLAAERKRIEAEVTIASLKSVQEEISARLALGEILSDEDRARLKSATNAMNTAVLELEAAKRISENSELKLNNIRIVKDLTDALKNEEQQRRANTDAIRDESKEVEHLTDIQQHNQKVTEDVAATQKRWTDESKAQGEFMSAILSSWAQRLNELSPAARQAFDGFSQGANVATMSLEDLQAAIAKTSSEIAVATTASGTGIAGWARDIALKALEIERGFLNQKIAIETAATALKLYAETGQQTSQVTRLLGQDTRDLEREFYLLDEQDLGRLRAALDSANGKLREMQQETEDARVKLAEMNAELLEAQGMDQKAEILRQQLSYEQQLAEIEAQLAEAQTAHNTELVTILTRQKTVLEEINRTKLKNIEAEAAAATAADKTEKATRTLASHASDMERISQAMSSMAGLNFGQVEGQFNSIATAAAQLRDVL